jgi:DNA invertase Pin-like site-specific DNA recombinase
MKIIGYCRISNYKQSIKRQIENISKYNTQAEIVEETFTGTTSKRPLWSNVRKRVTKGDIIIFDSVSRMSRNSDEGIKEYFELMEKGVILEFLKEPYINTEIFQEQLKGYNNIYTDENDLKPLFDGIKETLKRLAEKQIKIAFEQAEKEVKDLQQRTKEGLRTAKANGVKLGQQNEKLITKKSIAMKEKIKKINVKFGGKMNNEETMKTLKIARNTLYKYLKELQEGQNLIS